METEKLPGTLNTSSRLPEPVIHSSALNTSTWTSKVPSSWLSSAVMPDSPWPPPKFRPARLAPMATVMVKMPSLKEESEMPSEGPSMVSGPRPIPLVAVATSWPAPVTAKVAKLGEPPEIQADALISTLTWPSVKMPPAVAIAGCR